MERSPTKTNRVNGWSQTQFERRRSRKTISFETFILHQLFSLLKHFGTQTEAWKGKLMERKICWERNFNKTSSGIFGDWLDERWKKNFLLFLFLGWIDETESITSWLWLSVDSERKSRQLRLQKYKWIEIFSPFTSANKKAILRPSMALQHSFYFPIKILVNIDDAKCGWNCFEDLCEVTVEVRQSWRQVSFLWLQMEIRALTGASKLS